MNEVTHWIINNGITEETLTFLLYIPIIATLVNFSRYVVGFKTLGVYASLTLAFSYIFTGIRFGILITFAVIASTLITYSVLKKVRMHYISRITVNYILVALFIILIITLNEISPISITTSEHSSESLPTLSIILIVTLSDFFIKQYVKKDLMTSVRSLSETIAIAVIGWGLLRMPVVREFVLDNLWLQPLLLILNLSLGKYTGLRLKEFFRFKKVLSKD
jgi:hypothetical protein